MNVLIEREARPWSTLTVITVTMDSPTACAIEISDEERSFLRKATDKAATYHGRVPYLSKLPFPAVSIITTLVVVNIVVWAAVGVVLASILSPASMYTVVDLWL